MREERNDREKKEEEDQEEEMVEAYEDISRERAVSLLYSNLSKGRKAKQCTVM